MIFFPDFVGRALVSIKGIIIEAFTDFTVSDISLTNLWADLAVRTKFDQYYSTVLQPLNWFLRYDQSMNLLVKYFCL